MEESEHALPIYQSKKQREERPGGTMMKNDLIFRKDVEQMLADLGGCDVSEQREKGWDEAIDAALDELRKIKAADEWIPCSERLPEDKINPLTRGYYTYPVTVTIGDDLVDIRYYKFGEGHWWNNWSINMDEYVIAWQPELEPWEGEK